MTAVQTGATSPLPGTTTQLGDRVETPIGYSVSCKPAVQTGATSPLPGTTTQLGDRVETPIGYSWIPLFRNGALQSGQYDLPVAIEPPPQSYCYLTPDVNVPNIKWLDHHKNVFSVTLNAVSTVHTQDPSLDSFFLLCHQIESSTLPGRLSDNAALLEAELRARIADLLKARPEPLVNFLHAVLDRLLWLMVCPPVINDTTIVIGQAVFDQLGQLVKISALLLDSFCDQHGRSSLLTSYIDYTCELPHVQSDRGVMTDSMTKKSSASSARDRSQSLSNLAKQRIKHCASEPQVLRNSARSRGDAAAANAALESIIRDYERSSSRQGDAAMMGSCVQERRINKYVHEELLLHWVVSSGASRQTAMANAWFFLELIVKSMAEFLSLSSRMYLPRNVRFSEQFVDDVSSLCTSLTSEIIARIPKDYRLAVHVNTALAFFLRDLLSLIDRTYVFSLIRAYIRTMNLKLCSLPDAAATLMSLKLDFLRIVCSHEHFLTLNLPFFPSNTALPLISNLMTASTHVTSNTLRSSTPSTASMHSIVPNNPLSSAVSPSPSVSSRSSGETSASAGLASLSSSGNLSSSLCQTSLSGTTTSSSSSSFVRNLSPEYRSRHFLLGLLFVDVAAVMSCGNRHLQRKAVNAIRALVSWHDADSRLNDVFVRQRVASLYVPLLGLTLDSLDQLYRQSGDPARAIRKVPATSRREKSVVSAATPFQSSTTGVSPRRRFGVSPTVALNIAFGATQSGQEIPSPSSSPQRPSPVSAFRRGMNLEVTRHLLVCVAWVLKHTNEAELKDWMLGLGAERVLTLLEVLRTMVTCFEYRPVSRAAKDVPATPSLAPPLTPGPPPVSPERGSLYRRSLNESWRQMKESTPTASSGGTLGRLRGAKEGHHVQFRHSVIASSPYAGGGDVADAARSSMLDVQELSNTDLVEGNLATEVTAIVIDSLELLVEAVQETDYTTDATTGVMKVLLHILSCNESETALERLFECQRAFCVNHPWLVFDNDTEICSELCIQLLRHCASSLPLVRSHAAASIYSLMRQSFQLGGGFARVKTMATMALSSLVGTDARFEEEYLKRSLQTILQYCEQDRTLQSSGHGSNELVIAFREQVKDLIVNLHMILSDTVKMKSFQHDFEMLLDLMYRVSKGYQNSPDLRVTWLLNMAQKHSERKNFVEAAHCTTHAAALVTEILEMQDNSLHRPKGCIDFLELSHNILEETAISDDLLAPTDEHGICESRWFTELGLCQLLENAATLFSEANMFEAADQTYNILIPIYRHYKEYQKLSEIYSKLSEQLARVDDAHRDFGTYFRVGFYGVRFGDLDGVEFIYKEPSFTKLSELTHRLQSFYADRFGNVTLVEVIKDSNNVNRAALNPDIGYLQITFVEPFFDRWELLQRKTAFERHYNIRRFTYSTPFTRDPTRPHGPLSEQHKRKTVLTTTSTFPYVKTRLQVIEREQHVLGPIEVAIEDVKKKTLELQAALRQEPPDPKMLQMVIQGGIGPTVNQGPIEVANTFLLHRCPDGTLSKQQHQLRLAFKQFSKACADALTTNKRLITPDQREYQKELERNYVRFTEQLAPMVSLAAAFTRSPAKSAPATDLDTTLQADGEDVLEVSVRSSG